MDRRIKAKIIEFENAYNRFEKIKSEIIDYAEKVIYDRKKKKEEIKSINISDLAVIEISDLGYKAVEKIVLDKSDSIVENIENKFSYLDIFVEREPTNYKIYIQSYKTDKFQHNNVEKLIKEHYHYLELDDTKKIKEAIDTLKETDLITESQSEFDDFIRDLDVEINHLSEKEDRLGDIEIDFKAFDENTDRLATDKKAIVSLIKNYYRRLVDNMSEN
ncbi:hypothetical protein HB968_14240 [Listeria welshimeri]|nr:hypothetical protein [Listeria welshimeri]